MNMIRNQITHTPTYWAQPARAIMKSSAACNRMVGHNGRWGKGEGEASLVTEYWAHHFSSWCQLPTECTIPFIEVQLPYISFMCTERSFNICVHCKVIIAINLGTVYHSDKLVQRHWLCSPCCTLYPWDFISNCKCVCTSCFPSTVAYSRPPLPSGSHLVLCESVALYSLDSTCKWDHIAFVSLCLTYFTSCNTLMAHPCCKWKGFIRFSRLSSIPLVPSTPFPLSIHPLIDI